MRSILVKNEKEQSMRPIIGGDLTEIIKIHEDPELKPVHSDEKKKLFITKEQHDTYLDLTLHPMYSEWGRKKFPNWLTSKEHYEKGLDPGPIHPDGRSARIHDYVHTRSLHDFDLKQLQEALSTVNTKGHESDYFDRIGEMITDKKTAERKAETPLPLPGQKYVSEIPEKPVEPFMQENLEKEFEDEVAIVDRLNHDMWHRNTHTKDPHMNPGITGYDQSFPNAEFLDEMDKIKVAENDWALKAKNMIGN
jgi:hypothetical protein